MLLLLSLLACGEKPDADDSAVADDSASSDDSAADDSASPDDSAADDSATSDDSGTEDHDRDADGYPESEDCDDRDAAVNPAAEEVFNGYDDDCDGVVDANGDFTGRFQGTAVAQYEGDNYRFTLDCPTTLSRALSDVDFEVVCTQDTDDDWAMLLLGETITITPHDGYHWSHESWSDRVEVASSNGWDTDGDGSLRWTSLERAELNVQLSAVYLSISGQAVMTRQ